MPRTKARSCSQHVKTGVRITQIAVLCRLTFFCLLTLTDCNSACALISQGLITYHQWRSLEHRGSSSRRLRNVLENCSHRLLVLRSHLRPFMRSPSLSPTIAIVFSKCGQTIAYQVLEHRDRPERTRCVNLRRHQLLLIPRTTYARKTKENITTSVKMHK